MAPKVVIKIESDSSMDISSDSSSDSFSDSPSEDTWKSSVMTMRGKNIVGDDTYDRFCVFHNLVAMYPDEVAIMKNICAGNEPRTAMYICTLQESHIATSKGKMSFNKEFTKTYLRSYLSKRGTDIRVLYNKNKEKAEVRMKISKDKKYAIMTSNWMSVADSQKFDEGDILMFWFRRSKYSNVKVMVDKLEAGAFGLGTQKHLRLLEA